MELREIQAAVAVYRHGSFTRAAPALFISQSALTRRVAQLEQVLGTKLFDRTSHGVELTTSGVEFMKLADRIIHDVDSLQNAISSARRPSDSEVTVAASSHASMSQFTRFAEMCARDYPDLSPRLLSVGTDARAVGAAHAGDADFALVGADAAPPEMISTRLWTDYFVAAFSANSSVDEHAVLSSGHLRGRTLVRLPEAASPSRYTQRFFDMFGVAPKHVIESTVEGILSDLGRAPWRVAVMPRRLALGASDQGIQLVRPPESISRSFVLARGAAPQPAQVQRFEELAITYLSGTRAVHAA